MPAPLEQSLRHDLMMLARWCPLPRPLASLKIDIAHEHNITIDALCGPARSKRLVIARRDFCVRARKMGASTTQIGEALKRDHSTVVHHLKIGG